MSVLTVRASVQLDGSGNGTASVGPLSARETWHPDNCHVNAMTGVPVVNEASCQMFVGDDASQRNFRDITYSGSSGDASDKVSGTVKCPHRIFAVWSGGDPGAYATMSVTGTLDV